MPGSESVGSVPVGSVPVIREREVFENFTTCLAMILAYHGGGNHQDLLRQASQLDCQAGASFAVLARLARDFGFEARGLELEESWLDQPDPHELPCIVYYTDPDDRAAGCVVVEAVTPSEVTFISTKSGRKRVSRATFLANWRRLALVITPGPDAFATPQFEQWQARARAKRPSPAAPLSADQIRAIASQLPKDNDGQSTLYDLIIVGAGPAGIATACQAQALGLRSLVLEKGAVVEALRHFPPSMAFVSPAADVGMPGVDFPVHSERPTTVETIAHYERVTRQHALPIRPGEEVLSITGEHGCYCLTTPADSYYALNVVLATGYWDNPKPLPIPGIDLAKVSRSYSEAYRPSPRFRDKEIAVVGAGVSAVSVALQLHQQGGRVTLLYRGGRLKYSIQEEGARLFPKLESLVQAGEITLLGRTQVLGVTSDTLHLRDQSGREQHLPNDYLFVMIGYTPHVGLLEGLGVEMFSACPIPLFDFATFETTAPGLFVAGTAKGFGLFRHFRHQAQCICQEIARRCGAAGAD